MLVSATKSVGHVDEQQVELALLTPSIRRPHIKPEYNSSGGCGRYASRQGSIDRLWVLALAGMVSCASRQSPPVEIPRRHLLLVSPHICLSWSSEGRDDYAYLLFACGEMMRRGWRL